MYENIKENIKDMASSLERTAEPSALARIKEENSTTELSSLKLTTLKII